MNRWFATALAALDVSGMSEYEGIADFIVIPTSTCDPIGLYAEAAGLWQRLVKGLVSDEELSESEYSLLKEFNAAGLATNEELHEWRISAVSTPWMTSLFHELVYAMLTRISVLARIPIVFIKGPALHQQGLRERAHSGDVDVWVEPELLELFVEELSKWGWSRKASVWDGTELDHSVTLLPSTWGCEIDVHRYYPGCNASPAVCFFLSYSTASIFQCGSVDVKIANRVVNGIIYVLHDLRSKNSHEMSAGFHSETIDVLRKIGSEVISVCRELDTIAVMRDVLVAAFPDEVIPSNSKLPTNWILRTKENSFVSYLYALRIVPMKQKPRLIRQVLVPGRAQLAVSDKVSGRPKANYTFAIFRRICHAAKKLILSR